MPETSLAIPGETAIITGAGSGIGREITSQLTNIGIDVVINDVDEDALSEAKTEMERNEGNLITLRGDASNPDTATTLVDTAVTEFGGIDIVVNNVGVAGPTKPCEAISTQEFMETLEINLGSMFATTKAAIPHLRESNTGRIVNLSSMSGKRPLMHRTPYTTAKMGVIGFTRTLATELAEDNITVNAICPGSVEGSRLNSVIEGQAESQGRPISEVEEEFKNVSPMGKFVQASDVAETVVYLCSDHADRTTGQDLNVTAGIVMY